MPFVKVGTENTADIEIHYNDHGTGKPIVLIHGYPLDGIGWTHPEEVNTALLDFLGGKSADSAAPPSHSVPA